MVQQKIPPNVRMEPYYLISVDIFHNWLFIDDYVDSGEGGSRTGKDGKYNCVGLLFTVSLHMTLNNKVKLINHSLMQL